jgi:NitT/TauT family transport system ATP-binding protein
LTLSPEASAAPGGGEPSPLAIRISGVSVAYRTRGETIPALSTIDLDIASGEFVSLIGPSGCGKSTLLRCIGDLLQPNAGSIDVHGKPARQARRDRDYGIVFQAPVLYDWRTVEKNVQLPLELMKVPRAERNRRSQELLELVGLHDFRERHPWELSGGMQQRVAIARALSFRPSILLMDEPFGALDEMTRERLNLELLDIWSRTGTTVVFVTHSIPEAVFLSDRIVIMTPRPGRIEHVVEVDLPRPRDAAIREDDRFFHFIAQVRNRLYES